MMVILVIMVDGSAIVVRFCVRQRLLRMVDEVSDVLLILVHRVMVCSSCQRIYIYSVETSMMIRAVIEVLGVIVIVVMSRNHVRTMMIVAGIGDMVHRVVSLFINVQDTVINVGLWHRVMKHIQVLNVVITMIVKGVLIHVSSDHCIFLLSNLVSVGFGSHDIVLVAIGVESTSSMGHTRTIAILVGELLVIKWILLGEVFIHWLIVGPSIRVLRSKVLVHWLIVSILIVSILIASIVVEASTPVSVIMRMVCLFRVVSGISVTRAVVDWHVLNRVVVGSCLMIV